MAKKKIVEIFERKKVKVLKREFFIRDTRTVAKDLLGKNIVHKINEKKLVAKVVETEAYLGDGSDPSCHAHNGPTPRSKIMFGLPGFAYVYFSYGNHWLLNFVTEKEGKAGAVLIRAVEPVEGIEIMKNNRQNIKNEFDLSNGPAKLTKALAITKEYNGKDITKNNFFVEDNRDNFRIVATKRIGISSGKEKLYRFYIKDNPYISKKSH